MSVLSPRTLARTSLTSWSTPFDSPPNTMGSVHFERGGTALEGRWISHIDRVDDLKLLAVQEKSPQARVGDARRTGLSHRLVTEEVDGLLGSRAERPIGNQPAVHLVLTLRVQKDLQCHHSRTVLSQFDSQHERTSNRSGDGR